MTQEEKIKDLEERIAAMSATDSALCADLEHWKKVASGSKGRNKQLMQDVEKWKAYGKEADELNEKKALRIDVLEKALDDMTEQRDAAIKDVEKINELNAELSKKLADRDDALSTAHEQVALVSQTNKELSDEICANKAQIDWYNNLPWWKKVFVKRIEMY